MAHIIDGTTQRHNSTAQLGGTTHVERDLSIKNKNLSHFFTYSFQKSTEELMALLQAVIIFMVAIVAIAWATFNSQCSPSFTTTKLRAREPHTFYSGPIIDHVLRGRAYRNATRHSHVTCATFCLQDVGCRSFNYCPGIKLCELNSDVFATDKSDLQPSSGCLYFDEEYHKGNETDSSTNS